MLTTPMDVMTQFPVRKSKKQKQAFRDAVQSYVTELGYISSVEKGGFGSQNLVIGEPEKAKYLVTAHYDTCARMPIPNLITPCGFFAFLGYQFFVCIMLLVEALFLGVILSFVLGTVCTLMGDPFAEAITISIVFFPVYAFFFGMPICAALMIIGPANKNNANDNTSGVITLLEIARTLPENQRHKVCFVLFDLEEAGLIGSASYRKIHKKETDQQLILNLDCVGEGDHLIMLPTKKLKKDRKKLTSLYKACGYFGSKSVTVREKGFAVYPSDQGNFPFGVGICALKPSKFGLYLGRIHTPRDTILEETNINILRAALTTFICCDAAQ